MSPFHPSRLLAMRRIVLPTDFSVRAERALPRALALAEQLGAEIHLVHVLPAPGEDDGSQEAHAWREERARARLEATRMAYRYGLPGAHSAPMELVVVRDGPPATAVAKYAREHRADLIVPRITAQLDADLIVLPARLHRAEPPDLAYQIVRAVSCSVLAVEQGPTADAPATGIGRQPHIVPLPVPSPSAAKS